MTPPLNPSINDSLPGPLMVFFKIISRHSWDNLQSWHEALPGSQIEHVMKGTGIFVLHVPRSGAGGLAG